MKKICARCVMDSDVIGIRFDDKGICNYCKIYDQWNKNFPINKESEKKLKTIIEKIKKNGKNKKYDCIVGVSGGLDSTYTLYYAKKKGLRPLAVHIDNGWNTELSVNNIKNAVSKLGVDLYTRVLDWEEFKDLQVSFLKASVPDAEIPTDIAIRSVLYKAAAKEKVKYILTGVSFRTEGKIPQSWTYLDGRYIKDVQKKFGTKKLKDFPNFTLLDRIYYNNIRRIKRVNLLYYMDYSKEKVQNLLMKELGWRPYPGKHYESIYTRFIQAYLLPKKFNIDKRKVHFSALINSGQMTREEALEKLKEPPYPEDKMEEDLEYVIKKLDLTREEFEEIYNRSPKTFLDYSTSYSLIKLFRIPLKLMYRFISPAPPTFFEEMKFIEEDIKKKTST
ncbi:MAG: N-acetyl sugar amidotransferase [Thermoplasmata archaeon]|nr:MAG: N-acetyl sugar amidotransferase [Thermoplasmata archaeon]